MNFHLLLMEKCHEEKTQVRMDNNVYPLRVQRFAVSAKLKL